MRIALAILFMAVQAHAVTRYVSKTGNGTAPFLTWAEASTNIQFAITAADSGDTILVAPGIYNESVTINKNLITVQGGNGTLWDADRTIIDRQGALNSVGVTFSGATNSTLRGITVMGTTSIGINMLGSSNIVDSCVARNCTGSQGVQINNFGTLRNSIIVGGSYTGTYPAGVYHGEPGGGLLESCIVEANSSAQVATHGLSSGYLRSMNNVHGNIGGFGLARYIDLGGNVTNNTTNSIMRLLNIAPASDGIGTNLVWAGVGAYIPRIGSVAQGSGIRFVITGTERRGDGGPSFDPYGFPTNNYYANVGSPSYSTVSPFGDSATTLGTAYVQTLIAPTTNFSYEAFLRYTNLPTTYNTVLRASDTAPRFYFLIQETRNLILGIGANFIETPVPLPSNSWFHVAVDYNGAYVLAYTNGSLAYSNSIGSQAVPSSHIQIGRGVSQGKYTGEISEFRYYGRSRTPSEIASGWSNRGSYVEGSLSLRIPFNGPPTPSSSGPFNIRNPTIQPSFMEAF